jgi:riboflavin kinase / FMN adenylyltransferase
VSLLIPDLLAEDLRLPECPSVVTIGVFDGVHLGHQALLNRTVIRAREIGARALAIVFDPRPREILRPELPSEHLMSLEERTGRICDLGLDAVAILRFDTGISRRPAEWFVQTLVERFRMVELCVGPDFALGRGRGGDVEALRALGERLGYGVIVVEPFELDGEAVRSTLIRTLLAEGEVRRVARLLGRRFAIVGEVERGFGRGRTIGLPTANVAISPRLAVPANGVYVARCAVAGTTAGEGELVSGVANIGNRPTFDAGARTLEVHLLDFAADIYGARLRVEFVERLRPEEKFASLDAFLAQIGRDIGTARRMPD